MVMLIKINKRGAEYTTSTIIVIVLALLVLVVLAMGFGAGWSNLWSKISGFFTPVNVDAVKQACQYACTTQSVNAYCCQERDVRLEKGGTVNKWTCNSNPLIKPDDCDITCAGVSCAGVSGAAANFDTIDQATLSCNNACKRISVTDSTEIKNPICNLEVKYKSGTSEVTSKCSGLGNCIAICLNAG